MTRRQFLNKLYRRLWPLGAEEAEQHLTYYAEMLADRMEEGMTEEEAVASLEDVDTIARRILEDAGVEPDQAADSAAPVRSVGNGRKWAVACVVGLLVLAVLGAWVFCMSVTRNVIQGTDSVEILESLPTELEAETAIEEVTIVDRGSGAVYAAEEHVLSAENVRKISIQWTAGEVLVFCGESGDIIISESAAQPLSAEERMSYDLQDGELKVRSQRTGSYDREKTLMVQLPVGAILEEMEVETVSASVEICGGAAQELELDSVSGALTVEAVNGGFPEVSASTVSGFVRLEGDIPEVELESTSGDLSVAGNQVLRSLDAETVSGLVQLSLPMDTAFTLRYETTSGSLNGGPFALYQSSGKDYSVGTGGARLDVESVSGDLELLGE